MQVIIIEKLSILLGIIEGFLRERKDSVKQCSKSVKMLYCEKVGVHAVKQIFERIRRNGLYY